MARKRHPQPVSPNFEKSPISEICTRRRAAGVLQCLGAGAALLCEPGPDHLSHAFHFAPRVPNMLCSSSRSGMIFYATTRCVPSARRLSPGDGRPTEKYTAQGGG
ncbi:hypothetical protein Zmor_002064 [Zophobas morio]|uniref:Uncharacterized protein n=1 Tax=Zophobas morio TaxID=2755281 RepID=A0AA38JAN1_9CUCU|nr:hypothetical protein Zmor_002064 [Zophobas morio]